MQRFSVSPLRLIKDTWIHRGLILNLSKREIVGRYRGSFIGIFWSFLTPLLMLVVFTFVFGEIFQARWGARGGGGGQGSLDFAVALFAGLLIFNFFSECISRAPSLVTGNANYVKKVVFPLEILTPVTLIAALFHLLAGYSILLLLMLFSTWEFSWHMLLLPVVFAPCAKVRPSIRAVPARSAFWTWTMVTSGLTAGTRTTRLATSPGPTPPKLGMTATSGSVPSTISPSLVEYFGCAASSSSSISFIGASAGCAFGCAFFSSSATQKPWRFLANEQ